MRGRGGGGVILYGWARQYFETYPIQIPGLWKKWTIHILDHPKCWPIHVLLFDFFYPFFAGCYTYITVNSCNTKRISSLEKSLRENYVHIPGCQKNGAFHIGTQKIGPFIYFLLKKVGQSYTWQCWKRGLFGTHIHTMPYIGSYPPEFQLQPVSFTLRAFTKLIGKGWLGLTFRRGKSITGNCIYVLCLNILSEYCLFKFIESFWQVDNELIMFFVWYLASEYLAFIIIIFFFFILRLRISSTGWRNVSATRKVFFSGKTDAPADVAIQVHYCLNLTVLVQPWP